MKNINQYDKEKKEKTAANGRFGASGGMARPTVCADFQSFAPVQVVVETPACRQAAATLGVSGGQRVGLFKWTLTRHNLTVLQKNDNFVWQTVTLKKKYLILAFKINSIKQYKNIGLWIYQY